LARGRCASWEIQQILPAHILRGDIVAPVSQRWGSELHQLSAGQISHDDDDDADADDDDDYYYY